MILIKRTALYLLFSATILVGAALLFFSSKYSTTSKVVDKVNGESLSARQTFYLTVNGERFVADIAETAAKREQGLSGRAGLGENEAMFFIFDTDDRHGFWMKGMLFPIDIVWLNAAYRVVYIQSNASPSSYPNAFFPDVEARYVAEFSSGTASRLGLKKGDYISLEQ